MPVKVAINGFGRIGRAFLRSAFERDADVEVVAINDVADAATLAALLRHDSVYGRFPEPVTTSDGVIVAGDSEIPVLSEAEPAQPPVGRAWRGGGGGVHGPLPHPGRGRATPRSRRHAR